MSVPSFRIPLAPPDTTDKSVSYAAGSPKFQRISGVVAVDLWTAPGPERPEFVLSPPECSEPVDWTGRGTEIAALKIQYDFNQPGRTIRTHVGRPRVASAKPAIDLTAISRGLPACRRTASRSAATARHSEPDEQPVQRLPPTIRQF